MKKKLLLFAVVIMAIACMLAVSVSAADKIVTSTTDAYGELTTFDEAIGNTNISQSKDDGTIARTVLYDGTNYYTVPTTYILTESAKTEGEMLLINFTEISEKLGYTFSKASIIRSEIPSEIAFICNNMETYNNCANMVEIKINKGLRIWDNGQRKVFTNCKKLQSIDISGMVLNGTVNTYAMFENCESLETVILPDAYTVEGTPINYDTDHMFSGCKKLTNIVNLEGFMKGVTSLGQKTFSSCSSMTEIKLWDGLTAIENYAFSGCSSITSIVFPESVTTIGTTQNVFASCTSLKKIVLPDGVVSLGDYCFEKCTALTDVWMPGSGSTFGKQVFGQIGSDKAVKFYFQTADVSGYKISTDLKSDPFVTAITAGSDERLKFNTPISTKCTVFYGEHSAPSASNDCTSDICCERCATVVTEAFDSHSLKVEITYDNGFTCVGVKTTTCQNSTYCTCLNKTEEAPVIFVALGYSYNEATNAGLCGGFEVNLAALEAYKNANQGKSMTMTLVIFNAENLPTGEDSSFFDSNGVVAVSSGIVTINLEKAVYSSYSYKICNFSEEQKTSLQLSIAMIVKVDDKIEVIQRKYAEDEASGVKATYTDANGIAFDAVTVESVIGGASNS